MNTQKYMISSLAAAVWIFFYGFLIYAVLLADYLAGIAPPGLNLAEGSESMLWIGIGCLIQGFGLGFLYTKGHEAKGMMEGVRFGLYVGIFIFGMYVLTSGVSTYSLRAAITYGLVDTVMYMGAGVVFAMLYKK